MRHSFTGQAKDAPVKHPEGPRFNGVNKVFARTGCRPEENGCLRFAQRCHACGSTDIKGYLPDYLGTFELRVRKRSSIRYLSFFLLLYCVLELQNRKVQLYGCFSAVCLQVVIKDSGDQFPASLHECLLIRFIFNNR